MNVLIVDDHPLVRAAMGHIVQQLATQVTVIEAADCDGAVGIANERPDFDLVLLDLDLPGVHGLAALDRIHKSFPTLPVVIVSMFRDQDTMLACVRHGAMGFIPKSSSREAILDALKLVLAGSIFLPATLAEGDDRRDEALLSNALHVPAPEDLRLTARQGQVLALMMKGRSNKEICRELGLAERTVKGHVTAVLTALKVASRTQAVIAAGRIGLVAEELLAVPERGD